MAPDSNFPPMKSHRAKKSAYQGKKGTHSLIPFDEFLIEAERLFRMAQETLQRDGHHCPILILFVDEGMEVAGLRVSGDRPMHEYVKAVVQARKARGFVCISEAWMVHGPEAETSLREAVRPSKHPERREVLAVSAVHPEGRRMWAVPFSREGGRVTFGAVLDSSALGLVLGGGIPEALGGKEEGQP